MAKILVVDDDTELCGLIAFMLQQAGHTVKTAYDGEEAMAAVSAYKPDAVVLDIVLPVKDGLWVVDQLSKNKKFCKTPVVLMTSSVSKPKNLSLMKNVISFLIKPFKTEDIVPKIQSALKKKK